MRLRAICSLAVLLLVCAGAHALIQTDVPSLPRDARAVLAEHASSFSDRDLALVTKDGILVEKKASADRRVPVIIRVKGDPLGPKMKRLSKAEADQALSAMHAAHERVIARLLELEARAERQPRGLAVAREKLVRHRYFRVFNGISARVSADSIRGLRELPDVADVYPDAEVQVTLTQSVPLINADDVWAMGFSGQGVVVAIVDTGIDYRHPDLGGGFGPGYKVIGGYDFCNDDADPIDDHHHGTHVAGIVAANGTLKGVAPQAKLLAYKVLSSYGSGSTSDVVAGIERALDPDQNPSTDDGADIINLSLGSYYTTVTSPLAQAVENATQAGALCVCAAGNSGPYYWEVYAPGCAPSALTVGASYKSDVVTSYSSRGPAYRTFYPKPDCVAPGDSIKSCVLNGGYAYYSGTSMAAPHASGVAALLKSASPSLTPELLKALIMQGAVDLGRDVLTQGTGRVDAYKSLTAQGVILPASIGLGVDAVSDQIWQQQRTLTVKNISSTPITYQLTTWASHSGIAVTASPSQVTVPAGQTAEVVVTVSADNSVVPELPEPFAHSCKVIASSPTQRIVIPIIFLKCAVLQLSLPTIPSTLCIHDRKGIWLSANYVNEQIIYCPTDAYDMLAYYWRDRIVVKEAVTVQYTTSVTIDKAAANRMVRITSRDKNGNTLPRGAGNCNLQHIPSGAGIGWEYSGTYNPPYYDSRFPDTFYTTDISNNYRWFWTTTRAGVVRYTVRGYFDGVSGNKEETNDPADFKHLAVQFCPAPQYQQIAADHMTAEFYQAPDRSYAYALIGSGPLDLAILSPPYVEQLYCTPQRGELSLRWFMPIRFYEYTGEPFDIYSATLLGDSAWIRTNSDSNITGHVFGFDTPQVYSLSSEYLPIGIGPDFWACAFCNSGSVISVGAPDTINSAFIRAFYTQMYDFKPHPDLPCDIYRRGQFYLHTTLHGAGDWWSPYSIDLCGVPPDFYTVKVQYTNWYVAGMQGKTTVDATFDMRLSDKNPPYIVEFNIISNGEITDRAVEGRDNRIRLKVRDNVALASVALYYKDAGGNWQGMPVTRNGDTFGAAIPVFPLETYVPLRVVATDTSGNWLNVCMDPAFIYSQTPREWTAPSTPIVIDDGLTTSQRTSIHASWQAFDPESGVAEYQWAVSSTPNESGVITNGAWQTAGAATEGVRSGLALVEGRTYYILVKARNGVGMWSEIGVSDGITVYAPVLLVDDAGGAAYRPYFESALNSYGKPYLVWSVSSSGPPSSEYLSGFGCIVWFTGDETTNSLTSTEASALGQYLDRGGRLFITGQNLDAGSGALDFIQNYLRAYVRSADVSSRKVTGTTGGLFGGQIFYISGGDGARNQRSPTEIDPRYQVSQVLYYDRGTSTRTAGQLANMATYKAAYFSFGFEGISTSDHRNLVMAKILDWLTDRTSIICASVGDARKCVDCTPVSLASKTVVAVYPDGFYVEEADRSAGIKVVGSLAAAEGELKNVTGFLDTVNGERVIRPNSISSAGTAPSIPRPLASVAANLGGWHDNPPAGVTDGLGLYNLGLLMCVWGRVTDTGSGFFVVDDGSRQPDGFRGIRVDAGMLTSAPKAGTMVKVTGICTSADVSGRIVPVIRPRRQADVVSL